MSTLLNPYISFKDNARQALEFYKSVFGGELKLNTFKEYYPSTSAAQEHLIMHGMLKAGSGMVLMAADTPEGMEFKPGTNISMSLSGEDEAELKGYFQKLSAGGMVGMPLEKQIWGDTFGMCVDKFGISWMVNVNAPSA